MTTEQSPRPIHALWVVHYPVFGGPHNRIARLRSPLTDRGVEVTAVIPSAPGNAGDRLRAANVPVIEMELARARATTSLAPHLTLLRQFRQDIRRLRGAIRFTEADVVIIGGLINSQAAFAARLEDVSLVWQVLDSRTPDRVSAALMPVVDRLADVTTFAGPGLIPLHPGAERLTIPKLISTPGVDTVQFRPSPEDRRAIRDQLGLDEGTKVVGMVANVNRQKGIEHFVRAAQIIRQRVPSVVFVVVGAIDFRDDGYFEQVKQEMADLGIPSDQIRFVGDQVDVSAWYPAMDVKILTSVGRSEGTPTVILEAWACEVPVVATDAGSVSQAVADGVDGYVVPPADAQAMAERTVALLTDGELRRRFVEAARIKIDANYTIDNVADTHEQAIRMALVRRRPDGAGSGNRNV